MGIEFNCDKCRKAGDGIEAYCGNCFSELETELGEAQDRILELERELELEKGRE